MNPLRTVLALGTMAPLPFSSSAAAVETISFKTAEVKGVKISHREAGDPAKLPVPLLHGFPTSIHMFRNLIPQLAGDFRMIAPDLPGFGFSDAPDHQAFPFTFAHVGWVG